MLIKFVMMGGMVYFGLIILLFLFQAKLIFMGSREVFMTPAEYNMDYEDVYLDVSGQKTHGWYVPVKDARGTLLFAHGNAGNLAYRVDIIAMWNSLGLNVLAFDYGGYGNSTGSASELRCYEDGRAMWHYLTDKQKIASDKTILYGRSLGGGVAAQLATEFEAAGLILESTFSSVTHMAKQTYPFIPASILVRHRFDTIGKLPDIKMPLLMLHSPYDTMIPYSHGKMLFKIANEPKEFVDLGGGHNDGVAQFDMNTKDHIRGFLERTLK